MKLIYKNNYFQKMLLEKPFNKNNNDVKKKRREILNYLSFIKFWAMILIIRLHILIVKKHRINYGARMCEFLFIEIKF